MKFLFIVFLFPLQLFAQAFSESKDISGVWTGSLYNDTTKQFIHYELAISDFNGKLSGYSHTTFVIDGIKNIGVKEVKIKNKKGLVAVEDEKLIDNNYTAPPAKGVRTFINLILSENDRAEVLSGPWHTNRTREYNSLTGTAFLEKKKKINETAIIPKLQQLGLSDKLSFLIPTINERELTAVNNKPLKEKIVKNSSPAEMAAVNKKETETIIPDTTITNPEIRIIVIKDKKEDAERGVANNKPSSGNKDVADSQASVVKREEIKLNTSSKQNKNEPGIVAEQNQKKTDGKDIVKSKVDIEKAQTDKSVLAKKNLDEFWKEVHAEKPNITDRRKNEVDKNIAVNKGVASSVTDKKVAQEENPVTLIEKKQPTAAIINPKENVLSKSLSKKIIPPAAEISSREIETIRTVEIIQDSLVFSLYDNGTVDGDTVSVLLNGVVIMPRIGLLEKAFNKTIYLTPEMGDSINIIMYAENLGSIAPNTGLLVVRDGSINYEIRFSGDLKKNSAIILKRKRK
jgi:hypothetical protein